MSKLNSYLSSVISGANRRFQLPRLRTLGSRFLNLVVVLSMLVPNLAYAAEAAAPGAEKASSQIIRPAEEQVSTIKKTQGESGYSPPEFTHPRSRAAAVQPSIQRF